LILQVSDIFLPHPSSPNSFCLGPLSYESRVDLISCEANKIPFVSQDIVLDSWADSLRAWPNPPEGWVSWYNRVAKAYQPTWETIGIADALSLSLSPLEKNENLPKTIGYFWSDALNCFLFGHGPMSPILMDVMMITSLDIASLLSVKTRRRAATGNTRSREAFGTAGGPRSLGQRPSDLARALAEGR
jgi:hypothetical protein